MREVNWNNVKREAPKWFRDAKFGLFFHWGPYSVPAYQNEWYSRNMYCKGLEQNQYHEKTYGSLHDFGYKDFYDMLKGEKFDPDQWASLVKRSGANMPVQLVSMQIIFPCGTAQLIQLIV